MTTATAILARRAGPTMPSRSTAWSEYATRLTAIQEEIRRHLLDSFTVRQSAEVTLAELDEVRRETAREGWNGYGARPLDLGAYHYARLFIQAIPPSAPAPEVSGDPDGEVAFDWIFGPRMALTVSISGTGRCSFAWMRGRRTYSGTEWVDDGIPTPIADALWRLSSETSSPARAT